MTYMAEVFNASYMDVTQTASNPPNSAQTRGTWSEETFLGCMINCRESEVFEPLFATAVRPHPEYSVQALALWLHDDKNCL